MNTSSWFILIYQTAQADSQDVLARELKNVGGLTVQTEQRNGEYFVIVESPDSIAALTLHEFVMSINPQAELIDTHHSELLQPLDGRTFESSR